MNWEEQLGIKFSILIAGFMGAVASLLFEDRLSFKRGVVILSSGAATAAYLHPLLMHYGNLSEKFSVATGFILGLISMKVLKLIMDKATAVTNKYRKTFKTFKNGTNSTRNG